MVLEIILAFVTAASMLSTCVCSSVEGNITCTAFIYQAEQSATVNCHLPKDISAKNSTQLTINYICGNRSDGIVPNCLMTNGVPDEDCPDVLENCNGVAVCNEPSFKFNPSLYSGLNLECKLCCYLLQSGHSSIPCSIQSRNAGCTLDYKDINVLLPLVFTRLLCFLLSFS